MRFKHLLIFLLVSLPFYGQDLTLKKEIDSLEIFLDTDKSDTSKVKLYYALAHNYVALDSSKAFEYVYQGLKLATQKRDAYFISRGRFDLAHMLAEYNQPKMAAYNYKIADSLLSELMKKDSSYKYMRLWARTNFSLGIALSNNGRNEEINYLKKIQPIAERINAYDILAKGNTNIAIGFYNNDQADKAYEYFLKSEPLYKRTRAYESYAIDRLIFSSCLLALDSLDRAAAELEHTKTIIDTMPNDKMLQLYHTIKGEYEFERTNYEKAIENYKKSEELANKNQTVIHNQQLYLNFMRAYSELKNYKKAVEYAELCIANLGDNTVMKAEVYKELSSYKYALGNIKDAFKDLTKYVVLNDSLNTIELEKELNRLETQYKTERKEREILELKNTNDQFQLSLERKKSQNYFLVLISLAFLFLAALGYLGYRNNKRKAALKVKEINELKHMHEVQVYNAILEGQENERKRLAIDLHDGLAGRLSATRINLEKLTKTTPKNKETEKLNDAVKSIDNSLVELRNIARNLMPETVLKYGLKAAVEDYCTSLNTQVQGIRFILQFYDSETNIPKSTLLTLYRIIQELINNAIKHANATEVLVQYLIEDGQINITVEDNGVGFSVDDLDNQQGMGLQNLKARVAYLNGDIDFDSTLNEGTTAHIVITI